MLKNEVYSNVYVYAFSPPIIDIDKYTSNSLIWFITYNNHYYIITKEDFHLPFPRMKCDYVVISNFRPYFIVPKGDYFTFCDFSFPEGKTIIHREYEPYDDDRWLVTDATLSSFRGEYATVESIKQQIKKYKINRLLND